MCSEEFSLTWDDHHSTLVGVFEKLLETSTLVDCTIAAEGQYLKAHKVVLSACSPYFELLFGQEHEKNPIVVLKDIKFRELRAIIDFIYRGKVKIPEDQLADFVDAAESLQIKGLGGEHRRDVTRKSTFNTALVRKKEGPPPNVSTKRLRSDCFNAGEIDISNLPSETEVNEQISISKSVRQQQQQQQQLNLGNPSTSSTGVLSISSTSNGTASPVPFAPIVQSEQACMDTNLLTSAPTFSPKGSERVLLGAGSVMKVEPEQVCEVFLPEPECLIEPKKEMCMDEVSILDCEEDATEEMTQGVHDQESTNHYSDFPPMHETLEEGSDNSFLATQMAENINVQGAVSVVAGPRRVPGRGALPAAAPSGAAPREAWKAASASSGSPSHRPWSPTNYQCRECGEVFSNALEMNTHVMTHAGKDGHACPECGKTFADVSYLRRHWLIHTGERPYRCDTCGSAFNRMDNLRAHMRVHTGEKPFRCDVCGKTCAFGSNLLKHKRYVHGAPPAQPRRQRRR